MKRLSLIVIALLLATTALPHAAFAQGGNLTTLVSGNTAFALDLYKLLDAGEPNPGNIIVSPYSISQAFAMTYAGARGDTAAQMAQTLHFALDQAELHRTFLLLNGELLERGNVTADPNLGTADATLRIANALWGEKTYPFLDAYIAEVKANYGAGLELVDFVNNTEPTRQQINDWVAEQTEDRIQNILPQGVIDSGTRLVLTNAIYFKNAWLLPFQPEATQDADFNLLDDTKVTVPMMMQQANFGYVQQDGYQAVSLYYSGAHMSMLLILPDADRFILETEQQLTPETLTQLSATSLAPKRMNLYLPRFRFEYSVGLSGILFQLGMENAFNSDLADFSGMANIDPQQNLFLTAALHKAFIAVDEEGTEAAAATAVMAGVTSAPVDEPIEVRFDRPFIFVIRDDTTNTVLFMGRVANPANPASE